MSISSFASNSSALLVCLCLLITTSAAASGGGGGGVPRPGVASVFMYNTSSTCLSGSPLLLVSRADSSESLTPYGISGLPYNISTTSCTRIVTRTSDIDHPNDQNQIDVRIICNATGGAWKLRGWKSTGINQDVKCDTTITPDITLEGNNADTCTKANLSIALGTEQGSVSVTCSPSNDADLRIGGDRCAGATDCATVMFRSATSDHLNSSCSAVHSTFTIPADSSCQTRTIINNNNANAAEPFSFKLTCGSKDSKGDYSFTWQGWAGAGCNGNNIYEAKGTSINGAYRKIQDTQPDTQYRFYPNQLQGARCPLITPLNNSQPLPIGFPDRITVACQSGATVLTYAPSLTSSSSSSSSSSSAAAATPSTCLDGSVMDVHIVKSIDPTFTYDDFCHRIDPDLFVSTSVFLQTIRCTPDGRFSLRYTSEPLSTDITDPCKPTFYNTTINGTSGDCIVRPTGNTKIPNQAIRVICNGNHTEAILQEQSSSSSAAAASSAAQSSSAPSSTGKTSGTSSGTATSTSSSSSSLSTSTGTGTGSGSTFPNAGVGLSHFGATAVGVWVNMLVGLGVIMYML